MYDAGKIIPGLTIFVVLITFPLWYSHGKNYPPLEIKLDTPSIQKGVEKRCVEPTAYMKAKHMELIDSWRQAVVRHGERIFLASDGKKYEMNLSHTCLNCHSNKEQFCDRCHTYEGVKPDCWECHVVPKGKA